jgi:uncharacterized protein YbjT (DUF2867 family)
MRIAVAGATGLVGRQVNEVASQRGHEIVPLARSLGVDLTSVTELDDVLTGVEAVIDVTQSPTMDDVQATEFFTTVASNLGAAARAAGVQRTVVLSIIGVDAIPDFGYYVAKLAQENAARAHAPGVRVLRAAQFMEFPEQMLGWYRDGDAVTLPAMPTQPVDVHEIADLLVSMADGTEPRDHLELAGPKAEALDDLVRQVAARRGEKVTVTSAAYSETMANGACLPGPDAILAGPDFATWLSAH